MPLQFKNIAVGNLQDDVSGNNYAANKAVYILNLNNTLAQIFSDEAGAIPIVQDGVNNVTNSKGVFGFWVEAGDYFVQVGANKYRVSITGADYFNNRIDETVNLIVDSVAGRGAYYVVGSFEAGFTYTDINQVGTFGGADYYIYTGGLTNLPHNVTAGTNPTLSSDYAQVFYSDHDVLQNRDSQNSHPAAAISTDDGLTSQRTHDTLKATLISNGLSGDFGFFESGFTYSKTGDVGVDANGDIWLYIGAGTPNKVVSAGTVPSLPNYKKVNLNKTDFKILNSINLWRAGEGFTNAQVVNVLGDSISFGAGANGAGGTIPDNGWVRVLQKMMNIEWGGSQYGFISSYGANGTGTERHQVIANGSWSAIFGAAAGHLPNGWAQQSSTVNDTLVFNFGSFNKAAKIWYDGSLTGSFSVTLNGLVDLGTITTDGSGNGLEFTNLLPLTDGTLGGTQLRVTVLSGDVAISGVEYLDTDLSFRVNNFSRDGRAGRHASESVIREMCQGARMLIWALGVNDRNVSGPDLVDYKQRIDWLIQYANQFGTRVVIPDFLFTEQDSHPIRQELYRAALSIHSSVYVPFPNLVSTDGAVKGSNYLINTVNFSYDSVHLSVIGNRLVAETIAQAIGLSVTSKAVAEQLDKAWLPLRLLNGAVNSNTNIDLISRYRFNNNTLEIALLLPTQASGTVVATINLKGRKIPTTRNYLTQPDPSGNTQLVSVNGNGDVTIFNNAASPASPVFTACFIQVDTSGVDNFVRYQ